MMNAGTRCSSQEAEEMRKGFCAEQDTEKATLICKLHAAKVSGKLAHLGGKGLGHIGHIG
jgi:hypothetical protein